MTEVCINVSHRQVTVIWKRRNKPYILDNLAEVGMWKKSDMEIFYTQTSIQPLSPLALG